VHRMLDARSLGCATGAAAVTAVGRHAHCEHLQLVVGHRDVGRVTELVGKRVRHAIGQLQA